MRGAGGGEDRLRRVGVYLFVRVCRNVFSFFYYARAILYVYALFVRRHAWKHNVDKQWFCLPKAL